MTEGLTLCNYGWPGATCGCAINFHYNDTSIIIDTCGIASTRDTLQFVTYNTSFKTFSFVNCSDKMVTTSNRFNDGGKLKETQLKLGLINFCALLIKKITIFM